MQDDNAKGAAGATLVTAGTATLASCIGAVTFFPLFAGIALLATGAALLGGSGGDEPDHPC